MTPTQISSYEKWSFTATVSDKHHITHDVYSRGEGKVLIIIQELPGIGQETLSLADQFVTKGYKVILPHLFGPIGKTSIIGNLVRVFCMRKELKIFSTQQSSPIVDWLRALCNKAKNDNHVKGVAVIGMCLTGNFAISLMADDAVLASFASQPSLPVHRQAAIQLSADEIENIKHRLDELGQMHCARFEKDKICQSSKFDLYDKAFNQDGKERIKLHTLPGNGHSILTLDFVDENGHPTKKVLEEVMNYFDASLKA